MLPGLKRLLPTGMYWILERYRDITELRLRRDKPLVAKTFATRHTLEYTVTESDITHILRVASGYALYAVEDTVRKGYISCVGGVRIGLSGEGVLSGDNLISVKNISALVIRLPHETGSLPAELYPLVSGRDNTLIVSPPYCGKTTLLRQLIKEISDKGIDTLVIDERGELSATVEGESMFDIGSNTDILYGIPKLMCYEGAVRTMSPQVIATDEIFGEAEVQCLVDINRCGMRFLATIHGDSVDKVKNSVVYSPLNEIVDNYVLLSDNPHVGTVKELRLSCLA